MNNSPGTSERMQNAFTNRMGLDRALRVARKQGSWTFQQVHGGWVASFHLDGQLIASSTYVHSSKDDAEEDAALPALQYVMNAYQLPASIMSNSNREHNAPGTQHVVTNRMRLNQALQAARKQGSWTCNQVHGGWVASFYLEGQLVASSTRVGSSKDDAKEDAASPALQYVIDTCQLPTFNSYGGSRHIPYSGGL